MKTVTLSTRLAEKETRSIDAAAREAGLDRGSFLKQLIRRGYADLRLEKAVEAYRKGQVTLSRAAESAGLSVRDFLARMPAADLELNYGTRELEKDIERG